MARIIIGGTLVRFPLGGWSQTVLGWLRGFQQLGHEVYFVEKSGWENACYEVPTDKMTDDCSYGISITNALLDRFDMGNKWCFVDAFGRYHGLDRLRVESLFRSADLFVDLEWNEWDIESQHAGLRVFVDGEPGWFQMKLEKSMQAGETLPKYDAYYTTGRNLGMENCSAPTAGITWSPIFFPVLVDLLPVTELDPDASFTTVMNWQSHNEIEFGGKRYGQKDLEFAKFLDLPSQVDVPMEVAVSGKVPRNQLRDAGWRVRQANEVTERIDYYWQYITQSMGEFSVAKHVFRENGVGWISDREGYYMSAGRPVVLQDTGLRNHLPSGRGLFMVNTIEEAADAIKEIKANYTTHSQYARDLANEYFDAKKVLGRFLYNLGI